jgi:hypothetical protein
MTKKTTFVPGLLPFIVEGDWGLTDDDGGENEDRTQQ